MRLNRNLLLLSFLILFLVLSFQEGRTVDKVYFSCGSDSSTNGDTLYIPCNGTHNVRIEIKFANDTALSAITVPLIDHCYGSNCDAYLDPIYNNVDSSYAGSRIETWPLNAVNIKDSTVLYGAVALLNPSVGIGEGLFATMIYTVKDTGRICLDSLFFPPANVLEFISDSANAWTPNFYADTFIIAARSSNDFPNLTLHSNVDTVLTSPQTICIDSISATDPDAGDTIILEMIEGPGTFDPDTAFSPPTISNASVCFDPVDVGDTTYWFKFRVKDQCPAEVYDSFSVRVQIGQPPVLSVPDDVDTFLCAAQNICIYNIVGTDTDAEDTLILEKIEGPGTFTPDTGLSPLSDSICFVPAGFDSTYRFIFRVTDPTLFFDEDTFFVSVDIDEPPSLNVPADVDTCLAPGSNLCVKYIEATDGDTDDTLILEMVSGPGTFVPDTGLSPLSDSICFGPESNDSTYKFVFKVKDSCDSSRTDSFYVNVNVNQPPVINLPADIDTFLCSVEEICFDSLLAFDPDSGDTFIVQMIEGAGTFDPDTGVSPDSVDTNHCFTPVDKDTVYRFIFEVTDPCGLTDRDTLNLTVDMNEPPVVTVPADTSVFRCEAETLCFDIDISDPDNPVNVSVNSPWYYQSADTSVCLFASNETTYPCTVIVTDSCNAADTGVFTLTMDLNEPPVVTGPPDTSVFICQAEAVCFDIGISDSDNPTSVNVNSPWYYQSADTSVCVFASSETTYPCTVIVTDSCLFADTATFTLTVDINNQPVVTVPSDTSIFLCQPETLCFDIQATDPDVADTLVLEKVEGPGIFLPDTGLSPLSDSICFYPENFDSTYRFIFKVKDQCPAEDYDTFQVTVTLNKAPLLSLPADIDTFLCEGQDLCIYNILATDTDTDDTLILEKIEGPGTFVPDTGVSPLSDSVCFTPDPVDSTYRFIFRVTDQCQVSHDDTFNVTVDMDDPPLLTLPLDVDTCLPPAQSLCIRDIIASDPNSGDTIILEKISGPGTFVPDTGLSPITDSVCFDPASNDSTYEFVFKVTDSCDSSRTDSFYVNVNVNRPPVITLPADIDTFLCDPQEICFDSLMAFDPDSGDTFIVQMIEGAGAFDPDTGVSPDTVDTNYCFTPADEDSTYRFIFEVEDLCGETNRDTLNVNVDINEPPQISAPETLWVLKGSVKLDTLTAADPDSNTLQDSAGVTLDPDCGVYSVTRISNPGGASGEWEISYEDTSCVDSVFTMIVDLRDTVATCSSKLKYDSTIVIIRSETSYNNSPIVTVPGDAVASLVDTLELIFTAADPDSDVILDTSIVFVKPVACGSTYTERLTPSGTPSGEWKVTFFTEGCSEGVHWIDLNLQDNLGAWGWDSAKVTLKVVDVPETSSTIISGFNLSQNYPNPFNARTEITFDIPHACQVTLKIYNLTGQLVKTLVDREMYNGTHTVFWDGSNTQGESVASGIYFYKLNASDYVSIRKMILLK